MSVSNPGLPPLDWLRVFEAAGRLGGFSKAAREFGLTQAAVSQRIANLESWLNRPLFIRGARGVTLTVDGESYLPLVQHSLAALERDTEDLFGTAPRVLRLAGQPSHLDALVMPRLTGFFETNPGVSVITDSLMRRTDLESERTWLQIRFGRGGWPGREAVLIRKEILVPMARPDLEWRTPAVDVRGERPGWSEWARLTKSDPPATVRLSVDSMAHGLSAAKQGLGVVLGSIPLADQALACGRLRRLDLPELVTRDGYWLTWPENRVRTTKQRRQIDALLAELCKN
ncbi:MAG: LysR family transcriptional regulator [Pseudomonadota bacterium]